MGQKKACHWRKHPVACGAGSSSPLADQVALTAQDRALSLSPFFSPFFFLFCSRLWEWSYSRAADFCKLLHLIQCDLALCFVEWTWVNSVYVSYLTSIYLAYNVFFFFFSRFMYDLSVHTCLWAGVCICACFNWRLTSASILSPS